MRINKKWILVGAVATLLVGIFLLLSYQDRNNSKVQDTNYLDVQLEDSKPEEVAEEKPKLDIDTATSQYVLINKQRGLNPQN